MVIGIDLLGTTTNLVENINKYILIVCKGLMSACPSEAQRRRGDRCPMLLCR